MYKNSLQKIQDLLLNKFNIILIFISVIALIYCLLMGQKIANLYDKFLFTLLFIFWLIHPFINKKNLHVGAYKIPYYDDDVISHIARLTFFYYRCLWIL